MKWKRSVLNRAVRDLFDAGGHDLNTPALSPFRPSLTPPSAVLQSPHESGCSQDTEFIASQPEIVPQPSPKKFESSRWDFQIKPAEGAGAAKTAAKPEPVSDY